MTNEHRLQIIIGSIDPRELELNEHLYKEPLNAVLLATGRIIRKFVGHREDHRYAPNNMERTTPTGLHPSDT